MAREQIAVRLPKDVLEGLDELVARGLYPSRAAAVRAGAEAILELDHRRRIDDSMVAGYTEVPPTAVEEAAALASLREAIIEEQW